MQQQATNGTAPANMDMDIDMDLDLGPLPEPEPEPIEAEPEATTSFGHDGAFDAQTAEAQYEKVHIRGVDDLTTDNIKQFAIDHFTTEQPTRIEWIDDTSANIIYSSPEVGLQALAALTQVGEDEDTSALPLRLRSAKLLSSHPDSVLQVRAAVKTDRKKPRAHEASRFYLMHPEHDPRERLRMELSERRRQGGDSGDGDYRRRRFDGRELRRRRDRDNDELISADMYDDSGAGAGVSERRRGGRRELFPDEGGSSGRLRNRSASPGRDTLESDRLLSDRSERRFRERSPRRSGAKELFPAKSESNARELFPTKSASNEREISPNKTTSSYLKKELFPSKVSNHRRTDAIDAADETLSSRITAPVGDSRNRGVELFPESSNNGGVNIRGTARDEGFSIRGSSNGLSIKGKGASVKELFPSTYSSNAGKELFSNKIEGRGGPRRRAEDMFG